MCHEQETDGLQHVLSNLLLLEQEKLARAGDKWKQSLIGKVVAARRSDMDFIVEGIN